MDFYIDSIYISYRVELSHYSFLQLTATVAESCPLFSHYVRRRGFSGTRMLLVNAKGKPTLFCTLQVGPTKN